MYHLKYVAWYILTVRFYYELNPFYVTQFQQILSDLEPSFLLKNGGADLSERLAVTRYAGLFLFIQMLTYTYKNLDSLWFGPNDWADMPRELLICDWPSWQRRRITGGLGLIVDWAYQGVLAPSLASWYAQFWSWPVSNRSRFRPSSVP